MPSLLDIRRRIRAVKSTQQITKAMKMVAASRLRRAQERIQQARPFATEMRRVLNSLASRVDPSAHPLLDERRAPKAGGKALLFVITADRGLCGSFNTNVIKAAGTFITETPGGKSRSDWSAGAAATTSRGAASRCATSRSTCSRSSVRPRAGDRRRRDRGVHRRPGRQRLPRLQRVQVGDVAARRRRAAAADPARGVRRGARPRRRRGRAADRLPVRAGAGGAVHAPAARATSRCRCSARCSSRTRRSTPRR